MPLQPFSFSVSLDPACFFPSLHDPCHFVLLAMALHDRGQIGQMTHVRYYGYGQSQANHLQFLHRPRQSAIPIPLNRTLLRPIQVHVFVQHNHTRYIQ